LACHVRQEDRTFASKPSQKTGLLDLRLTQLVDDHGQTVFSTAFRILGNASDAEDVTQDVLIEAFLKVENHDITNLEGWLRKLAVFRALDFRRKLRRESVIPLEADAAISHSASVHDAVVCAETAERLRCAVTKLPERESVVFSLRYFEQQTNQEISSLLGISSAAVSTALHRAKTKLVAFIQKPQSEAEK